MYKCRQLKSYNCTLDIKLTENGTIQRIFHPIDIEKVFGVDNIEESTKNIPF